MDIKLELQNLIEKNKSQFIFANLTNEVVKLANNLLHDQVKTERMFITEGLWSYPYIKQNNIKVNAIIINPESVKSELGLELIKFYLNKTKFYVISDKVLNKLTNRNDENGVYIIGELPNYNFNEIFKKDKCIICVLDGVEKSGNIGTILRSCDATQIDGLVIVNRRAKLTNTTAVKGSMGAIFSVPTITYNSCEQLMCELKNNGFSIYLADTRADKDYFNYKYDKKVALVMGSERYGISSPWLGDKPNFIKLKMLGQCDSLNVGVATSIFLYDIKMKQLGE